MRPKARSPNRFPKGALGQGAFRQGKRLLVTLPLVVLVTFGPAALAQANQADAHAPAPNGNATHNPHASEDVSGSSQTTGSTNGTSGDPTQPQPATKPD